MLYNILIIKLELENHKVVMNRLELDQLGCGEAAFKTSTIAVLSSNLRRTENAYYKWFKTEAFAKMKNFLVVCHLASVLYINECRRVFIAVFYLRIGI